MTSSFSVHNVFGDHMVVQRNKPIRVSGTGNPGSRVRGSFLYRNVETTIDCNGSWVLEFPPTEAGGPYEMTFHNSAEWSKSKIVIRDVLVGELWFCSGQSNMEFPVWGDGEFFRLPDGEKVAAEASDDKLRIYDAAYGCSPDAPCDEAPGRATWYPATSPEAVRPFSAVGYFFGRKLREALGPDVPVGVIDSSWGGTQIEPWIPESAYRAADRKFELERLENVRRTLNDEWFRKSEEERAAAALVPLREWLDTKFLPSAPETTTDALERWAKPESGTDPQWTRGPLTSLFRVQEPGIVWLRREFELPPEWEGRDVRIEIAAVNDNDETYLDGVKIGQTGIETTGYWAAPRNYTAKLSATPGGKHVLAVRVIDHYLTGQLAAPVTIMLVGDGAMAVDLSGGEWMRRVEFVADLAKIGPRPPVPETGADMRSGHQTPSTLYNAMVHPYTAMNIRGVAWYQGCSNSGAPADYLVLSRIWRESWRKAWRNDAMPFVITQLAAFFEQRPSNRLPDDFWRRFSPTDALGYAPIRESQEKFALEDPLTGIACTIDLGDHSDIHPARKRGVGERLASEALRIAYGRDDILPGPRFAAATREGASLRISFRDIGTGLETGPGGIGPHLFAIADADGRWEWADARLEADSSVVVSAKTIKEPVAVRYAWTAFPPDASLRRRGDGLPVFPFRTDA